MASVSSAIWPRNTDNEATECSSLFVRPKGLGPWQKRTLFAFAPTHSSQGAHGKRTNSYRLQIHVPLLQRPHLSASDAVQPHVHLGGVVETHGPWKLLALRPSHTASTSAAGRRGDEERKEGQGEKDTSGLVQGTTSLATVRLRPAALLVRGWRLDFETPELVRGSSEATEQPTENLGGASLPNTARSVLTMTASCLWSFRVLAISKLPCRNPRIAEIPSYSGTHSGEGI